MSDPSVPKPNEDKTVTLLVGNAFVEQKAASQEEALELVNRFHRNPKLCPKCAGEKISTWSETDGWRMNGDGFGKHWSKCDACGWSTYTVWDDY